jgi:hypothetical protein
MEKRIRKRIPLKVQPGDKVRCNVHPHKGEGTATYVNWDKDESMVAYGEFGDMKNRTFCKCKASDLTVTKRNKQ